MYHSGHSNPESIQRGGQLKKSVWIVFKWSLAWIGLIVASGIPTAVQASARPGGEFRADAGTAPRSLGIQQWVQQQKLIGSDGLADDVFGGSVALSGDGNTALVGAPAANVDGRSNQGAAYVFIRSGASWIQQAKLTADDGAADDRFGGSVALSQDGNTALIGAVEADVSGRPNQGAAYIFTRSGASWIRQAKLTADDGAAGDWFGRVALSADGLTALVGASIARVNGQVNQGAAYVFVRSGSLLDPADQTHCR